MDSLHDHQVYEIVNGHKLDDDDPPTKDTWTAGLESIAQVGQNLLTEYNLAFKHLQKRHSHQPVQVKSNLDHSASVSDSPVAMGNPTHLVDLSPGTNNALVDLEISDVMEDDDTGVEEGEYSMVL
jgi:hypothetical protein